MGCFDFVFATGGGAVFLATGGACFPLGGVALADFACAAASLSAFPGLATLPAAEAFFFRTLFLMATFLPRDGDGDLLESELLEPLEYEDLDDDLLDPDDREDDDDDPDEDDLLDAEDSDELRLFLLARPVRAHGSTYASLRLPLPLLLDGRCLLVRL